MSSVESQKSVDSSLWKSSKKEQGWVKRQEKIFSNYYHYYFKHSQEGSLIIMIQELLVPTSKFYTRES